MERLIIYHGKRYLVPENARFIATDEFGDVWTFLREPKIIDEDWTDFFRNKTLVRAIDEKQDWKLSSERINFKSNC